MFLYEMILMHYTVLVNQSTNYSLAYRVSLWHGTHTKPDGNDGGKSETEKAFALTKSNCHSLHKTKKSSMLMFYKTFDNFSKSKSTL